MSNSNATIKSVEATNANPEKRYRRWRDEITMAEKEFQSWHERGRQVVRRYLDERDAIEHNERRFNIFWANVGIMQSALYENLPKASVDRRFGQYMDDPARVASMMIQNCLMQDMDEADCEFDQVMRDSVEDRLIPGIGAAWLRLETDTKEDELEEQTDPVTGETIQAAATYERVTKQKVRVEHVHWNDFLYSPCRTWGERRWVGRKVYMDQDALVERFPDHGKKIPLDYNPKSSTDENTPTNEVLQKAVIYEIWDRNERKVYWLSKVYPELLDEKDDPLKLENFDPCPRPLFATTSTSNCVPVPDYIMLQDQYSELDTVNNRISLLIQACKVVGVFDAASQGVQRMLQEGSDNTLIPVDNWAMFAEKGGMKGIIDWLPLEQVVGALERLRTSREDIKSQIYELTGISDIVRGNTKASETLGAQKIKAQFASMRISRLQGEVARFAQDMLRLKAEIICRHFTPEQILKMSNMMHYMDGQNAPLVHAAMALIKTDETEFDWRVKIQADTLAQADHAEAKQEKVEFINAVATFLQSAATTLKAEPQAAPILFESLKFAISAFKGSRELETVIDQTLDTIMQKINNPAPPPPDPAVEKMKMEMQLKQQEAQVDQQSKQQEMQFKQAETQQDMQFKAAEHQQNMRQDQEKFMQELAQMQAKAMADMVKAARADAQEARDA
jgi:hypothetical protein